MAISVFVCFANLKFYYFCESESHLCSLLKSVAPLNLPYILYCILFSLSDKIASCYKKRHRNRQYNHIIRNTNIPAIRNYNALFIDGWICNKIDKIIHSVSNHSRDYRAGPQIYSGENKTATGCPESQFLKAHLIVYLIQISFTFLLHLLKSEVQLFFPKEQICQNNRNNTDFCNVPKECKYCCSTS